MTEKRKRMTALMLCMLLILLSACSMPGRENNTGTDGNIISGTDDPSETASKQDTGEDNEDGEQISGQTRTVPLSETDFALAECSVEGTEDLYEIPENFFGEQDVWINEIQEYDGELLIYYQIIDGDSYLAWVDPLEMKIDAQTALPYGVYYDRAIRADEEHLVLVYNQMTGEAYLFNEALQEYDRVSLGSSDIDVEYITEDLSKIYYSDYAQGQIHCFDVETEEDSILQISDVGAYYKNILGVCEEENCILINAMSEDSSGYILCDLDTGETLAQYDGELNYMESHNGNYIARCTEDSVFEILYGQIGQPQTWLLGMPDYDEYNFADIDMDDWAVLSEQECIIDDDERMLLNLYDLNTGRRIYQLPVATDIGFFSGHADYSQETGVVVFTVDGDMSSRIFVWDTLGTSSVSGDDTCYRYTWQNGAPPSDSDMEMLRDKAGEIAKRHGVEIYLGDDVLTCSRDYYEYEASDNVSRMDRALMILDRALERYPAGMLAQLDDGYGSILKIYLAGDIKPADEAAISSPAGIQNTLESDTFLVLDINDVYSYESTIYHEVFHAIECHLNMTGDGYFDYDEWESYNPEGFNYDYDYIENEMSTNWDYVLGDMDDEEDVYFIDIYSKSFPNEDRARIMEYAMMESENDTGVFAYPALQGKLAYICERVRKGFDTSGWPEMTEWEKWIR
ncbi:MAG: hypothetical protein ACI39Q_09250 [Wujia sp.]